jgi:hypothetical protein
VCETNENKNNVTAKKEAPTWPFVCKNWTAQTSGVVAQSKEVAGKKEIANEDET